MISSKISIQQVLRTQFDWGLISLLLLAILLMMGAYTIPKFIHTILKGKNLLSLPSKSHLNVIFLPVYASKSTVKV